MYTLKQFILTLIRLCNSNYSMFFVYVLNLFFNLYAKQFIIFAVQLSTHLVLQIAAVWRECHEILKKLSSH